MTVKAIPNLVGCDFCGQRFHPPRWNCRTCHRCAAASKPDQSVGAWEDYMRAVLADQRTRGVKAPVPASAFRQGRKFSGPSCRRLCDEPAALVPDATCPKTGR